eukprot:scaffold6445_cov63-Phaeocystis_antarctica.AAC.5
MSICGGPRGGRPKATNGSGVRVRVRVKVRARVGVGVGNLPALNLPGMMADWAAKLRPSLGPNQASLQRTGPTRAAVLERRAARKPSRDPAARAASIPGEHTGESATPSPCELSLQTHGAPYPPSPPCGPGWPMDTRVTCTCHMGSSGPAPQTHRGAAAAQAVSVVRVRGGGCAEILSKQKRAPGRVRVGVRVGVGIRVRIGVTVRVRSRSRVMGMGMVGVRAPSAAVSAATSASSAAVPCCCSREKGTWITVHTARQTGGVQWMITR